MEAKPDVVCGEPLGPRVVAVTPDANYVLHITFDNGEKRRFDAAPLLKFPAFSRLQTESFFRQVKPAYGTILWPNDIDYCPDTLYAQSQPEES